MAIETWITSFSIGLLAMGSPCVFPLYPGFLAYLSGSQDQLQATRGRYFLGFFVLAGVLTMMLLLGAAIALLSISIGSALRIIIPIADLVIISLGVLLLLNINLFKSLPQIRIPALSHPFVNAYIYGFLYGPIALPCSGPLVVSIFALSLNAQEALNTFLAFFWFGLGFGSPLFVLSFLAGAIQKKITRYFAQHFKIINRIGGIILVAVGMYDLWINKELISTLFLG
jgi:cytochrome c-type biogenesis protein